MQRIVTEGHQIANHGYSHIHNANLTATEFQNNIIALENYTTDLVGTSPQPYFRAPYGYYSQENLDILDSLGYDYTVGWNSEPLDWIGISSDEIITYTMDHLTPGSIHLLHANSQAINTPEALNSLIPLIQAQDYSFKTISELLTYQGVYLEESSTTAPSQVVNQVSTDQKVLSLTFDDGDSDENLSSILDTLLDHNVQATFFVNGNTNPSLIQRIVAEGHQIANHSYNHVNSTSLTRQELIDNVIILENYVSQYTGANTQPFYRPPYGFYDDNVLKMLGILGYDYTIYWTADPFDWSAPPADEIAAYIMDRLAPESIYLLHASKVATNTTDALNILIPLVQAQGYSFKTIQELLTYEGKICQ